MIQIPKSTWISFGEGSTRLSKCTHKTKKRGIIISDFGYLALVLGILFGTWGLIKTLEWIKNKTSPKTKVITRIVSKRLYSGKSFTTYYVTFEKNNGDRVELKISDEMYGMLAEGDVGTLTYQGSAFIKFDRKR